MRISPAELVIDMFPPENWDKGHLDLALIDGESITFDLCVHSEFRDQGHASYTMTKLCAACDIHRVILRIRAVPKDGAWTQLALVKFFRDHGFVVYADDNKMIRLPSRSE